MNDMIRFEPSIRLNVISSEKYALFPPLSPVSASYISIICKNEAPRYCINIWVLRWQWRGSLLPRHIVYPLIPCIDIPSTSCFWKKKNRISTGTIDSADIANVAP